MSNTKLNNFSFLNHLFKIFNLNTTIKTIDGFNLIHLYIYSSNGDIDINVLKLLINNKVKLNSVTRFYKYTALQAYLLCDKIKLDVVDFFNI
ncbi:hypothetical protein BTW14_gp174 [BeAn 58058 virus]|uniref:hypothetical protein n=1 Tax=BeAn 58058 virus TaxID=67082 RepID=UPI00090A87BD|nr:hypothetical protein BTW14_gp174 [BeAn 58058 virus]APG58365.1 hypothetical protein BAV00188 [BeAn 58058 virus]